MSCCEQFEPKDFNHFKMSSGSFPPLVCTKMQTKTRAG